MAFRKIPDAGELRELVAEMFVACGSIRRTAREIGLPASTVCRWLQGPALAELRRAAEARNICRKIRCDRHWLTYFRSGPGAELPAGLREMELEELALRDEAVQRVRVRLERLRVPSSTVPGDTRGSFTP